MRDIFAIEISTSVAFLRALAGGCVCVCGVCECQKSRIRGCNERGSAGRYRKFRNGKKAMFRKVFRKQLGLRKLCEFDKRGWRFVELEPLDESKQALIIFSNIVRTVI